MSGWGLGWFGGGNAAKSKEAPKKAILGLREAHERLLKKIADYQIQIDKAESMAKEALRQNNPNGAKVYLQRKKMAAAAASKQEAQLLALQQQIISIESANLNKETFNAMKGASDALKAIHGGLTVDKIEETMDELRNQQEVSTEISDAITGSMANDPLDEEELDEELERMQQEQLDEKLRAGAVPVGDAVSKVSTAPSAVKPTHQSTEEEEELAELKRLQEEMGMVPG